MEKVLGKRSWLEKVKRVERPLMVRCGVARPDPALVVGHTQNVSEVAAYSCNGDRFVAGPSVLP